MSGNNYERGITIVLHGSFMAIIKQGSKAPHFTLFDKNGDDVSLGKAKTEFTVLYFYPKDNTPGCTIEAQEFSSALEDFRARKAMVIGISGGDQKSKEKFCAKYSLTVPLVSDSDFAVSKAYGVYGDKKFMGRTFKGIHRKTFIVDKKGLVARIFDTVKPEGHAKEVLAVLDELRSGTSAAPAKEAVKTVKKKISVKQKSVKKKVVTSKAKKTTPKKSKK